MNVAMYLRKSRADENNPLETLERHKEILLSYAKDIFGTKSLIRLTYLKK